MAEQRYLGHDQKAGEASGRLHAVRPIWTSSRIMESPAKYCLATHRRCFADVVVRKLAMPEMADPSADHAVNESKPGSTLKLKVLTSWFSYRHPNIPALPKLIALLLVAYAFSPIDLIPDFIPVIGYLDDLVILPIGVYFLTKLIPAPIWSESEQKARYWIEEKKGKPRGYAGVVFVVVIWMLLAWLAWWAAGDYFVSRN
jgi:uncharacterized membrane protein YkvA (DUF1232 family)